MTETTEKIDYSKTLNLPQTDFPMRAGLPEKEPAIVKRWQEMGMYRKLREDAAGPAACRAEEAAAVVRQAWREAEEFNLNASLFLEALFVQLRRAFV